MYQTERYHDETFGYTIKMAKNGNYVLVIKFSEVYFKTPNQKVRGNNLLDESIFLKIEILIIKRLFFILFLLSYFRYSMYG